MDAAREAAAARDAAALQRQRDRNIKKRDEERAKRLASEKAKKTRLAAERRVRSCCSCVPVPTILPQTQSVCWRDRHASKLRSRAKRPPTATGRRPSAASVRVAPAAPRLRRRASMLTTPPCLCSRETQWTDPAEGGCESQERLDGE